MRAFHTPGMSLLTVRRHRVPGAAPEEEGVEARRGFHSVRAGFGSALVGLGGSMLFISTDACAAMAEPVRCMTSCLRRRISSSVRTSIARRTDRICLRVPHWNDEIDPEIADPDKGIGLAAERFVPNKGIEVPLRAVLSNSFGFGGTNATLILRRLD